jgi:ferritin
MKINKKVEEVLNKQVNAEFWSAYLYLAMSAWFETKGLKGFANWMLIQFKEETTHALKIFDFVNKRGGEIKLQPIAAVDKTWDGLIQIFEETYKHECHVTEMIHNCYDVAVADKDHASASMLKWFIDEQTEEEENALDILDKLKLIGEKGGAVYHLDRELKKRQFKDETKESE